MKKFLKLPKWLLIIFGVLVVIRMALPAVLLHNINKFLKDFSPRLEAQVGDLDFGIIRGAYKIEDMKAYLEGKGDNPFLVVDSVDVSISWREIFKGRFLTDITIEGLEFELSEKLMDEVKAELATHKKDAEEAGDKVFPAQISRVDIRNSKFEYYDIKELPLVLSGITGRVSNATPTPESPLMFFSIKGTFMDSSTVKTAGYVNLQEKPNPWTAGLELRDFETKKVNDFLRTKVPLTFTQGRLDLYSEMKSENGRLEGYIKPFLEDFKMIGNQKDFKGFKHAGVEIASAAVNGLLQRNENETLATKILFKHDQAGFDWNASEAINKTLENKFGEKLEPGLENRYQLEIRPTQKGDKT